MDMKTNLFCVIAMLAVAACGGQPGSEPVVEDGSSYQETVVFSNEDIIIRQIDEHTWEGNGNLCFNESIYIVEGEEKALLIDVGTKIPDLDRIVAGITSKPVMVVATHVHPDHTGATVKLFPEIYINAADMVNVPTMMKGYRGEIKYLTDGQVIDLGGREIEVIFTPGHTPGSTTFFDKERHYGFSGDAFGSTNLLLTTNFSTLIATTNRIARYMEENGIEKLFPGHYHGDNPETLQRVRDLNYISEEVLAGRMTGETDPALLGLNTAVFYNGVTVRYMTPQGIK